MSKMIAYCGLVCSQCPAYLATKNDDDDARKKTAQMYAKAFGFNITPGDINCNGCHSEDGVLISYCQSCEIRQCGRDRGIDNCTFCAEQPCEKLVKFHAFSPQAKASFRALLKGKQ
jgi:hypothetical protein